MPSCQSSLSEFHPDFVSLAQQPQWLNKVVDWHQQQWPQESAEQRRQKLQSHLEGESFPTTLLALQNDELLGAVSLVPYRRLGGLSPSYWLANAVVAPNLRRRGLGAKLVMAAEAYARQHNLSELYLYATDQVRFYERLHWQPLQQKAFKGELATIMRRRWES